MICEACRTRMAHHRCVECGRTALKDPPGGMASEKDWEAWGEEAVGFLLKHARKNGVKVEDVEYDDASLSYKIDCGSIGGRGGLMLELSLEDLSLGLFTTSYGSKDDAVQWVDVEERAMEHMMEKVGTLTRLRREALEVMGRVLDQKGLDRDTALGLGGPYWDGTWSFEIQTADAETSHEMADALEGIVDVTNRVEIGSGGLVVEMDV